METEFQKSLTTHRTVAGHETAAKQIGVFQY